MNAKKKLMEELIAEVNVCRKCRLWKHAKHAVPGEGNLDAQVMFIGEAPGYWEDLKGRPFVGAAGRLLDELLSNIGLERSDVYIGNVVKHRPPGNRDPKPDEIEACTPYLDRQIRIIQPKIIVTLGRHSTGYIFSKVGLNFHGITGVRGRVYSKSLFGMPVQILPMFHPAAALYNPNYKAALIEDFKRLKDLLRSL
ncbi:uracil-DNA glycosylase [Candidatus Bathyarchaeota archaeon]|nr:uracil-DNA glycosylase [Candidatus Bathyarchaeota archaeon]